MRSYGALFNEFPQSPDRVLTLLIAGSSGQAMDWGSTLSQIVRFSGMSTTGATINFMVNLWSTHAAAPSSGASATTGTTAGSTGNNLPVMGSGTYQVPPWSTGFSVAALSSGYIIAELWRK